MKPNPVLKRLGYSDTDRLVIIHTDDIGMCQASVSAFAELWDFGLISSGAVMIPCPWSMEAAQMCSENPEIDMGVHLTLTSEWENYRWGPISTSDRDSGMIDEQGFFYRSSEQAQEHGSPEAVQVEIQTQIDRAIANGIKPTHIDTHMGSIASPKFIPAYMQMSLQYRLPPMIMRLEEAEWRQMGMSLEMAAMAVQMVSQLEEMGVPLLDRIAGLELDQVSDPAQRADYAREALGQLGPGVTHFIIHPSTDTPELRAITPDWPYRVADYKAFQSEELRTFVENSGLHVIGYRELSNLMQEAQ